MARVYRFFFSQYTVITHPNPTRPLFTSAPPLCHLLQNLCAVDPALGHIILPFLLRALDPAAVNQPHQAPIAILTASVVFKPLLYPRPVILG